MFTNLRRLLLQDVLNFLMAVTVQLSDIVEQYILEQNILNIICFASEEHLKNFLDKILILA